MKFRNGDLEVRHQVKIGSFQRCSDMLFWRKDIFKNMRDTFFNGRDIFFTFYAG
jgi:hypothetical protein